VRSAGKVIAESTNGRIVMTVDSTPFHPSWDPDHLMVYLKTMNGDIDLNLVMHEPPPPLPRNVNEEYIGFLSFILIYLLFFSLIFSSIPLSLYFGLLDATVPRPF
jgi:hypothetical protein